MSPMQRPTPLAKGGAPSEGEEAAARTEPVCRPRCASAGNVLASRTWLLGWRANTAAFTLQQEQHLAAVGQRRRGGGEEDTGRQAFLRSGLLETCGKASELLGWRTRAVCTSDNKPSQTRSVTTAHSCQKEPRHAVTSMSPSARDCVPGARNTPSTER